MKLVFQTVHLVGQIAIEMIIQAQVLVLVPQVFLKIQLLQQFVYPVIIVVIFAMDLLKKTHRTVIHVLIIRYFIENQVQVTLALVATIIMKMESKHVQNALMNVMPVMDLDQDVHLVRELIEMVLYQTVNVILDSMI